METLHTPWGEVRRKISAGYGTERKKMEAEDLCRIAREKGVCMEEARRLVEEWEKTQ